MKTPGGRSRLRAQISVYHFANTTLAVKKQVGLRENFSDKHFPHIRELTPLALLMKW